MDPEALAVVVDATTAPAAVATADAAVEIAAIEADRDVTIATVNAETAIAVTEAAATEDEDMVWLNGELSGLSARLATLEGALSNQEATITTLLAQVAEMGAMVTALSLIQPPHSVTLPATAPDPATADRTPPENALDGGEAGPPAKSAAVKTAPPRIRRKWL